MTKASECGNGEFIEIIQCKLSVLSRLRSNLVPEHGARERFLMGTNVNTPLFQVPTPEFGHGVRVRVQDLTRALNRALMYRVPTV